MDHSINLNRLDPPTRRRFMTAAASTFLGVNLIPPSGILTEAIAAPAAGRAKSVIYIYLSGGMSHIDTFDPKPENKDVQGPIGTLKTSAKGIRVSEYLPKMAKQMDKVAIIRSLHSTQGAHERGNYFMHTSYTQRGTIQHPGMGAWATKLLGKSSATLPSYITVQAGSTHPGAGFFETRYAPLPIGDPKAGLQNSRRPKQITEAQFTKRLKLADAFDRSFRSRYDKKKKVRAYGDMYLDAVKLMKSKDLDAFDISQEKPASIAAYGDSNIGRGCMLARRLVENGVRFIEVGNGGWDTHNENFERLPDLVGDLDLALAALLSDLDAKGMLKTTMVVLATEFGRTPKINDRTGRDHYPKAFSCLLAGGGVQGGQAYGTTDKSGAEVVDNPIKIPQFNATIAHAMGLPIETILMSPSGRPFTVSNKAKPITAIF
jgi:hypothetical protein